MLQALHASARRLECYRVTTPSIQGCQLKDVFRPVDSSFSLKMACSGQVAC